MPDVTMLQRYRLTWQHLVLQIGNIMIMMGI